MTDAETITRQLGGRWRRHYGTAPCPVCQPNRQPGQDALTLTDGASGLLAHCKKSGCTFRDILTAAGIAPGTFTAPDPAAVAQREAEQRRDTEKRSRQALAIWEAAKPIEGSLAEIYLRQARHITAPLPASLRYHPECWHGPSARRLPALVALVAGADLPAVHRTYLRPDGLAKAEVEPGTAKMMLGATQGGAVPLADAEGALVVAEGIETGLSLASGLLRRPATIWAALSASGMKGLRLPARPGRLTIATDGDTAGREAGHALATRADALGWTVSLLPAPDGRDWADILAQKGAAA